MEWKEGQNVIFMVLVTIHFYLCTFYGSKKEILDFAADQYNFISSFFFLYSGSGKWHEINWNDAFVIADSHANIWIWEKRMREQVLIVCYF